jgi:hypothetical protein
MRYLSSFAASVLVGTLMLGWRESRPVECPPLGRDLRPVDLRGTWTLDITPDSAISLPNARIGRPLTGTVNLTRRDSTAAFIVYSGRYSAKLQSVGLARDTGEVLVSVPAGDTTRIVLDPSVDHGNLELVGKCRDDRVVGNWIRTGAPARAWGRFSMRRR